MMPEMDGYELLRIVKSRPGLQAVPFIFLTARADIEMKVEGLQEGADDYIVKPFDPRDLVQRVRAQIERAASPDAAASAAPETPAGERDQ